MPEIPALRDERDDTRRRRSNAAEYHPIPGLRAFLEPPAAGIYIERRCTTR
jgi:hypothetical protein